MMMMMMMTMIINIIFHSILRSHVMPKLIAIAAVISAPASLRTSSSLRCLLSLLNELRLGCEPSLLG